LYIRFEEEETKEEEEGATVGGQRQRLRHVLARVHVREHALVLEVVVGHAPSADLPCVQGLGFRVWGLGFGVSELGFGGVNLGFGV